MDFAESLKNIKAQMIKEGKENSTQTKELKPEKKEQQKARKDFESVAEKEERLLAEFLEFIQNEDIKRIR
ncbi:hypothetical protein [Campylobacter sp. MIT 97-5078]|uniref:hypothetical protein n=1 Tax=Campylobacter sp. MIT 97-5078 TaxID=1548153 RepID=UPI0005137896|nr:hypothetical protein [Campylobacter sp. MIT 97-5078]KGI57294.1 hypothetical protein LR59_00705 [Campylobacter sp. MIT 97-5078]TQR28242.1 hypothetical protein DMB91_00890 [Campylobacter sp. MIT 97-5078]